MDVRDLILRELRKQGELRVAEIVKRTGFSRAYVNRFFQQLAKEGLIALLGKARQSRYVEANPKNLSRVKKELRIFQESVKRKTLSEDICFNRIKESTGVLQDLKKNVHAICYFAFTEMLNNALDHSDSDKIDVFAKRSADRIYFRIRDYGVGIFHNIMAKKKLQNELEAIQDLLKGKQTTFPEQHSGEGIFFTSKMVDLLRIESGKKLLIFNNLVKDIFIKDRNVFLEGTEVSFMILLNSSKQLNRIFNKYTDSSFEFSKTEVKIKLYQMGTEYISRSQAKRVLNGLDKFKKIIMDFEGVETVGQGFADEVFRVWQNVHPKIDLQAVNANENVLFMIKRVIGLLLPILPNIPN
ncbi:MAG: DUF4325 domain-containing protein [Candidatus Gracilibacteria bacterium]|nr:DUF4325 domain-containing protein [Candidatus Gracilibacteria bacterium]